MMRLVRLFPIALVVGSGAWLVRQALPPRDAPAAMKVQEFGKLPVVYQGRVKPFDTLARNTLIVLSERQTFKNDNGQRRPAIEWLLDVMSGSQRAGKHRVFRITNLQLLTTLGLERRPGYRYAYDEFKAKLPELEQQVDHARSLEPRQRDLYDSKVLELSQKTTQYTILIESHRAPQVKDRGDLDKEIRRFSNLERFPLVHPIPPRGESKDWKPLLRASLESLMTKDPHPVIRPLERLLHEWKHGDAATFNEQLAEYQACFVRTPLTERPALRFEAFFNHFAPFYQCTLLYVIAFALGCVSWLGSGAILRKATFWLISLTLVVHTAALAARVYISGYPPITNLYGTAVFIGWGCVLLGVILELVYRIGVGNLIASVCGFLTLIVAHFLALSSDRDTLEMMQAVLDTKFWLATHVIIINFGYSATFLAGGLAVLYILRGVLTRGCTPEIEKMFGRMIYGIICFGLLLSFVGTVLGGLWADDSWGRFWGWDPKENGALMIVLWNALILHARWGGVAKTRGIALLAIFGGVITSWSWFGVNQLGVGLHSYGFTESVAFWLFVFVASQLVIIGVGLLPRRMWRSFATTQRANQGGSKPPGRAASNPDPASA